MKVFSRESYQYIEKIWWNEFWPEITP